MKRRLILGAVCLWMACAVAFGQQPGTVQFPTSLDTSVSLFEVANRASSTLSGGISDSATSLTLASAATFPNSGAITINSEILYYTGKSGNQLTGLLRGRCGSVAASQTNGSAVRGNIISCQHEALRAALIAAQTKLGTGSSTPTANAVFQGTGTGASAWLPLTGTAQTSFNVGSGTAKAGNTLSLLFSSDSNKPGFRWNGSTSAMQFSNDGSNWFDIGNNGGGLTGSGTAGFFPKFLTANSVGNSILSESGTALTANGSVRATARMGVGSQSSVSDSLVGFDQSEIWGNAGASVIGSRLATTLNFTGTNNSSHFAALGTLTSQNTAAYTGAVYGGTFGFTHAGTSLASEGVALRGLAQKVSTGTASKLVGVSGEFTATGSGPGVTTDAMSLRAKGTITDTVTNAYGLYVDPLSVSGAGAVQNTFGVYVYPSTAGSSGNYAIYVADSSSISQLGALRIGAGTATITSHRTGTTTWDPASIADGAMTTTTVTVSGALVGNVCTPSFSLAVPAGAILTCNITANSVATVTLFNKTGGALDLASGTVRASVWAY